MKKIYTLSLILILFLANRKSYSQCNTFTSSVPYFESFSSAAFNNQLPQCWTASNASVTCLTYSAGYAAFFNSPSGVNYFYTNGVYLKAGISYSAAVDYRIESSGSNWSDLGLLFGTAQASTGLTHIAVTTAAALTNTFFMSLSGVFSVNSDGIYYLAIKGTSGTSPHLYWDDLRITIPCSLNGPSAAVPSPSISGCTGSTLALNATTIMPNANTYTWSNGSNSASTIYTLTGNTQITLAGTKTLSGCSATLNFMGSVMPGPNVSILSTNTEVCAGSTLTLFGLGANNYQWNTAASTNTIVVSPATTTSYTVTGTNASGCSASSSITILVKPLPALNISYSASTVCVGTSALLQVNGASSYTWDLGTGSQLHSDSVRVAPTANATYTLTGLGNNGCKSTQTLSVFVDPCTGLSSELFSQNLLFGPNPVKNILSIEVGDRFEDIKLSDLSGRILHESVTGNTGSLSIDLSELSPGVYFLSLSGKSGNHVVQKILKE